MSYRSSTANQQSSPIELFFFTQCYSRQEETIYLCNGKADVLSWSVDVQKLVGFRRDKFLLFGEAFTACEILVSVVGSFFCFDVVVDG